MEIEIEGSLVIGIEMVEGTGIGIGMEDQVLPDLVKIHDRMLRGSKWRDNAAYCLLGILA
jgi:hypothetical protein